MILFCMINLETLRHLGGEGTLQTSHSHLVMLMILLFEHTLHCHDGLTITVLGGIYKGVSKSSRTVLVKEVCLPWMLNSSITFKVLPFCTNTAVPVFLPCLEASMEVPFWNCVKYPLRFLLNLFNGVESSTLHPKLQLREEEKVTGGQIG